MALITVLNEIYRYYISNFEFKKHKFLIFNMK